MGCTCSLMLVNAEYLTLLKKISVRERKKKKSEFLLPEMFVRSAT